MNLTSLRYSFTFELNGGQAASAVIESPRVLEDIITDLFRQIEKTEENFLFTADEEKQDLSKRAVLISSVFDLSYDKKTVQKRLFADLIREIETDGILERMSETLGTVVAYLDELRLRSDYRLGCAEEITLTELFKAFNVQLEEPRGSFAEKLMEYAETIHRLLGKDIFIVANCGAYLSKEDLSHIIKWTGYQGVSLFFVDGYRLPANEKIKEIIIDRDLCEIR
ncbi:MAG: type II-A CRISPR-associated protein Csn2 [Bacillota bacterium]